MWCSSSIRQISHRKEVWRTHQNSDSVHLWGQKDWAWKEVSPVTLGDKLPPGLEGSLGSWMDGGAAAPGL